MTNKTNLQEQEKQEELDISGAWSQGLKSWSSPRIPSVVAVGNEEQRKSLGEIGDALKNQLAFMKYPEFQTYENLERIVHEFPEDSQRVLRGINKHEISHRFCPYDLITSILLSFEISKALKDKISGDEKQAVGNILILFADMNSNTNLVRRGDEDIPWLYEKMVDKYLQHSHLGRVYARSMEMAWGKSLLPESLKLSEREESGARQISEIYSGDYFNKSRWRENARQYASIMAEFLNKDSQDNSNGQGNSEQSGSDSSNSNSSGNNSSKSLMKKLREKLSGKEKGGEKKDFGDVESDKEDSKDGKGKAERKQIIYGPDDISSNIPDEIDEKTASELAKRLAEIGTNNLPANSSGLKDYRDLMAGFGRGDPKKTSLEFYKALAKAYDVVFSTQPFGRPRVNPYQPIKWNPGMPVEKLDVDYSYQTGGRLIPGVTTFAWNSRRREFKGGIEEIVPDCDIYLDSSGSMVNPLEAISLGVLSSIVLSNKAHRKGARVRAINFSGQGQFSSTEFTRDLDSVFENFMTHYNGGTILPTEKLLEGGPKQVVIITDTYLFNKEETAEAIRELIKRNSRNRVSIYAISPQIDREYLEKAGAEVIQDTSTNIFKRVIGKANEVYAQ